MQSPDVLIPKKTYTDNAVPKAQMTGTPAPRNVEEATLALSTKISGSKARSVSGHPGDPYVVVTAESLFECLKFLRDDSQYLCQNLTVIAATDFLKKDATDTQPASEARIEMVYILYSYRHRFQLTVKVILPRDNPTIASVCELYRAANWYERECFDMLGVIFDGHPNHKRILTSPDWVGHPLRRDYVFPEEYNGMKVPL